jgi:hypothetical protein
VNERRNAIWAGINSFGGVSTEKVAFTTICNNLYLESSDINQYEHGIPELKPL